MFPGERDLMAERRAFLATVESLTDEEFESGRTLCEGWAPRDVLAHVVGFDDAPLEYVRSGLRVNAVNERIVARARSRGRAELTEQVRRWATRPPLIARLAAVALLGDISVHHQDVLRGLGRSREVPPAVARAILREGVVLGGRRLLDHRIVPSDVGRPLGRGRVVRGTAEQLGMWLGGRRSVEAELIFAD